MRKVRIDQGVVREVLDSGANPFPPFSPDIVWVECADTGVVEGHTTDDGKAFTPPADPAPVPSPYSFARSSKDAVGGIVAANALAVEYPLLFDAISAGQWDDVEALVKDAKSTTALTNGQYSAIKAAAQEHNIPIKL